MKQFNTSSCANLKFLPQLCDSESEWPEVPAKKHFTCELSFEGDKDDHTSCTWFLKLYRI